MVFHEATVLGAKPIFSSSRKASEVRPTPQHLSRGKVALSTTQTDLPAWAKSVAAAVPLGPAPTMTVWKSGCMAELTVQG
jgi:hypothetical protein